MLGRSVLKDDAPLKGEPLLWTTTDSQLVDVKNISGQRPDIRGMVERFKASGEKQILAMRLTGSVKSAFPDGAPKEPESEKKEEPASDSGKPADEKASQDKAEEEKVQPKPHVAESQEPLNLIVVADTDMLSNAFWVQMRQFYGRRFTTPVANNGDFVLNAVENLSGSSDLIGLRSRGSAHRPFTKIEEMQEAAQEQFKSEEQRLMRQLEETEKKLLTLQGGPRPGEGADAPKALTEEQKVEVQKFTDELLVTRKALRQVRHDLRKDIDSLRNRLSFLNIALVPFLVTIAAAGLGAARVQRRKRAVTANG